MDPIKRLFKELGAEVYKVIILESLLDAGICFFLLQLFFAFFDWSVIIPLVASLVFFGFGVSHRAKTFQLKAVEDKNPEIKEILRTARDNIHEENLLTLALFNELIEKMKNVSVGSLINQKKVMTKLGIVGVLAFMSIYFTTTGLWDINLDSLGDFGFFRNRGPQQIPHIQLNETDDIYGDIRVAKLGNEVLTIQIQPTLSDIDLSKVSEAEKRDLNMNSFPVDVGAQSDKVSSEDKPKEFQLAKEYNLKLHAMGE